MRIGNVTCRACGTNMNTIAVYGDVITKDLKLL